MGERLLHHEEIIMFGNWVDYYVNNLFQFSVISFVVNKLRATNRSYFRNWGIVSTVK